MLHVLFKPPDDVARHVYLHGGTVASWLVCSTLGRAVQVRALAGDIICSWARHFTRIVPLYLHPGVQMSTSKLNAGGNPGMD